jgi:hypothetical protein
MSGRGHAGGDGDRTVGRAHLHEPGRAGIVQGLGRPFQLDAARLQAQGHPFASRNQRPGTVGPRRRDLRHGAADEDVEGACPCDRVGAQSESATHPPCDRFALDDRFASLRRRGAERQRNQPLDRGEVLGVDHRDVPQAHLSRADEDRRPELDPDVDIGVADAPACAAKGASGNSSKASA